MAQHLGLAQLTYVEEIEELGDKFIIVRKETDEGYLRVKCRLPAVVSCLATSDFEPRIPNIRDIFKAKKKPFHKWDAERLGGAPGEYGLDGSVTQVVRSYAPEDRGDCIMVEKPPEEAVGKIMDYLRDQGVIG